VALVRRRAPVPRERAGRGLERHGKRPADALCCI
jgi:hypothetical protein